MKHSNSSLHKYFNIFLILLCLSFFATASADPPDEPTLINPGNQSSGNSTGITLSVLTSDPDADDLNVHFYGRRKLSAQDEFTIVGLPDTQYYTGNLNGGSPPIFYSQTQWILDNLHTENIIFVSHLGDCVENGDDIESEWKYADTAMIYIEDSIATALADGIPYAIAVGNHDQTPWGDPLGTTTMYNSYFGESRFLGRQYYGGHYSTNNDNSYQIFSGGGMDFIAIHLEYDPGADSDVLDWMDDLLETYADRRAIIVSHYIISPGNPGFFGIQGQAIYDQVKDNPNVFLMLGGHFPGEGQRTDTYNGNTIHSLLSDYQLRDSGGNGWLRIMKFSPATNSISVKTYSPWLDQWEEDADSEFTLTHSMDDAGFTLLGSQMNVPSGGTAEITMPDLDPNTEYEWFVIVDDGSTQVSGPQWSFTTGDHRLEIEVHLEGPFDTNSMQINLTDKIPYIQPFDGEPWEYEGIESIVELPAGTVDWILIELRDANNASSANFGSIIRRIACLLRSDGKVMDTEGSEYLTFPDAIDQELFLVIWHRNHLGILSAYALENTNGTFNFDFTTSPTQVFGGSAGHVQLPDGSWGMIAGDGNHDGIVDAEDKLLWSAESGQTGYMAEDLNLDQHTDNSDKNILWLKNLGKSSLIPQ